MKILLTPDEARVIGALMEKEVTTPDHYPLSANALTSACNQKSNRDPVLDLSEAAVQGIVDGLLAKHLVSDRGSYGGRVVKYKQIAFNTSLGSLQLADLERAIVCELLLRGPQSAGELRTRCARMTEVTDVTAVEAALIRLAEHPEGPFVVKLPRAAGTRDPRWAHLLCGEVQVPATATIAPDATGSRAGPVDRLADRVTALEAEVAELRAELAVVRGQSGDPG